MARRRSAHDDEDEPDDDPAEEEPEERPTGHSRAHAHRTRGAADSEDEPEEEEEDDGRRHWFRRGPKERVYFGARDSVFFELLVAVVIIILLLVGLFAYTQNWPAMYVVESSSMQHGTDDQVGLINTGDLVLAQKIAPTSISTYVTGMQSVPTYSTYGEYGDVVLYHPDGDTGPAPIIHRAILWMDHNGDGTYSFPSLQLLPCGAASNAVYSVSSTLTHCGTSHIPTGASLTLYGIGWQSVTVTIAISGSLGAHSGFVTMGDNNLVPGNPGTGTPDQAARQLVDPAWIVGVARGMIPWFGSVKLFLEGQASEVPSESWQFLGLTVVGVLGGALLIHLAIRRRNPREEDEESDDEPPRRRSRWSALAPWDSEPDDEAPPRHHKRGRAPPEKSGGSFRSLFRRGRPHPEVRKGSDESASHRRDRHHRPGHRDPPDDDEEEDL